MSDDICLVMGPSGPKIPDNIIKFPRMFAELGVILVGVAVATIEAKGPNL